LDSRAREYLLSTGFGAEVEESAFRGELQRPTPARQLAEYLDVISICGGTGVLLEHLSRQGAVVGPVVETLSSPSYNMLNLRTLESLIWLARGGADVADKTPGSMATGRTY
jgi:hypothetical protein